MSIRARFRARRGDFALDIDLEIPARGVTSVFGPSGCGKTTLLRAMAGLDRHPGGLLEFGETLWQSGEVFVPPHQRAVGYVFQEASLFEHLDVRRNIEFALRRVPAADRSLDLERAVELLDIAALLRRRPPTLSGGERQRVAIARALASSPRLLLLDEPLAALDRHRRREILPCLERLHAELDIPVVHVSHQPDEVARLASHLVLMDSGQAVASGPLTELMTRLDLPLAHDPEAAAVLEATVSHLDPEYRLTSLDSAAGRLTVLESQLETGDRVRVQIHARDVSLALDPHPGSSILNVLPARVDSIVEEGPALVTVRLLAGEAPLLSRITRKSADILELAPGKPVYAQVKSVALLN
ncbi:molybdenum ABC transporter ATP-binding protein [Elongatibacter sediminis]|uniref:Molybdenum ABC transporter ATP-binding protein n=1 Tax=Elongatibacter sediminis TaxID=3119006 RepID=A0AAW9RFD0_9GAMM